MACYTAGAARFHPSGRVVIDGTRRLGAALPPAVAFLPTASSPAPAGLIRSRDVCQLRDSVAYLRCRMERTHGSASLAASQGSPLRAWHSLLQCVHGLHWASPPLGRLGEMPTKVRNYTRYAGNVDTLPLAKHGRALDIEREPIRRPFDATPRTVEGWR